MLVLYSNDYHLHVPKYEYYDGKQAPHAERPDRIGRILETCKKLGLTIKETNEPIDKDLLKDLHDASYISYMRNKCLEIRSEDQLMPSVYIKDTFTPLMRHTYDASLKSANLAAQGASEIASGRQQQVYALCRPPGHHAEHDAMAGYCYINNAAVAANELSKDAKVAILDIDYHHGNGTQKAFYERDDVLYVSLHAAPENAFPYSSGFENETGRGDGAGNNLNIPLPPETTSAKYIEALDIAFKRINSFSPDYVVVSLGFDTYENDPIGGLGIGEDAFETIGSLVKQNLSYPTLLVQEGGYDVDKLSALSERFLNGFLEE